MLKIKAKQSYYSNVKDKSKATILMLKIKAKQSYYSNVKDKSKAKLLF